MMTKILVENDLKTTQIDRSGHRISQDLAGKIRENYQILQENTGTTRNLEAALQPGIFRIFRMISKRILLENTGSCRNPPVNSRP